MNKLIIALVALLVLVGGFYIFTNYNNTKPIDEDEGIIDSEPITYDTYTDSEVGVTFSYKVSPDGYIVDDITDSIDPNLEKSVVKRYQIINEREKIELDNSTIPREGPPTINLTVFTNSENYTASQWVDKMKHYSNIDLVIGDVDRDAVVAGANAVKYLSDGLYQNKNVVIANGDYIYHFTGSFLAEDSDIYRDFDTLIASVVFIPVTNTGNTTTAKIDPQVACESALVYMTFPNGAAADAFVLSCVNGEHPEVIERYIKDMGLDGARI